MEQYGLMIFFYYFLKIEWDYIFRSEKIILKYQLN
jgi:hypothetical protein